MEILCVDDEKCILKSLKRLFRLAGYEILTAPSAQEGLKVLTENTSISLVISDYQMPKTNGVSFLREVRYRWPDADRILLTGHADRQEVCQAVEDGVIQRLVDKPWQEEELLSIVTQRLGPAISGMPLNLPA